MSAEPLLAFRVTVIDRRRKRHRYPALARCWHEAWKEAANTHGLASIILVVPIRNRKAAA